MKPPLLIAAILAFLISIDSFGQREYKPGYIIKINGDSLPGQIAVENLIGNGNSCRFREKKDSEEIFLSPLDIKAYGSFEGDRYDSKMAPIINGQVFVHTILKGKMSLYRYYKTLYVETDKVYALMNTRKNKGEYIKTLNSLMSDCDLHADAIKYSEKSITNLIQNYNRCKGSPALTYDKKPKGGVKIFGYLFYGYDFSNLRVDDFGTNAFNTAGSKTVGGGLDLLTIISAPQFFFNTEISYTEKKFIGYSQRTFENGEIERFDYQINASWLRTPIGFGYKFSERKQSPYVKFGFSQYWLLDKNGIQSDEIELSGVVTTSYSKLNPSKKNQQGIWIAAGFMKTVWHRVGIFAEGRAEMTDGFMGDSIKSQSSVRSLTAVVGLRF